MPLADILRKNSFAIFLQVIGIIGLMANLYLASRLYPLADTDNRLKAQIETVSAKVESNQQLTDIQFRFITQQLGEIKDILNKRQTSDSVLGR